jgi:L-aminopeptidase/D-esterase-like protein
VRTDVTAIVPHEGVIAVEPLFAGCHALGGEVLVRVSDRFGRRRCRPSG